MRIVSPKHKTLKIGLNDNALKTFLTKIVWFGKFYSVVYVTINVFDQLIRKKKKKKKNFVPFNLLERQ